MTVREKIKVLIVDDSAIVRRTLSEILSSDPQIEVMATAIDPYSAARRMRDQTPDVITLDIEMPRMNGLVFLEKIMRQHPLPVVICSSITPQGSDAAMKAIELGAVDVIQKPRIGAKQFLDESKILICDAIKAAAYTKTKRPKAERLEVQPKYTADVILPRPGKVPDIGQTEKIIVVGASTGGTEAIKAFLSAMPINSPGIVIVQHMPEHFTSAFARRLDNQCSLSIKEAADNDAVFSGRVLIAPGNRHVVLRRSGEFYHVDVVDGPLVCRHRPSVDVLFRSAARCAGSNAVGVLMTGMGDDGARGLLEMRDAGAFTIAQDESTSVVFGMPNEAIKLGGVEMVLPLDRIAPETIGRTLMSYEHN